MDLDIKLATERVFERVNSGGEEIKNDLPNWIQRVIDSGAWKNAINPGTNKAFESVGQWLVANYPYGPGMGQGEFSITYDEFITLCANRPKLKDMLVRYRPKRKNGTHRNEEDAFDNVKSTPATGNSRLYLEERLQRDHKEIWKDYLAGKYKSARQAAIAAGFVKDTHDPVMRLKAYWRKASKKQQREFLKWIETGE